MRTIDYIEMANGSPIQGYPNYETGSEVQCKRKMDWLKTGKRLLKQLAKELELLEGSYDIRVNPAGPAVSGEAVLHGEWIYIDLGQSCLGRNFGFMWRTCKGRKDYTGNENHWSQWKMLLDIPKLACIIKQCHNK